MNYDVEFLAKYLFRNKKKQMLVLHNILIIKLFKKVNWALACMYSIKRMDWLSPFSLII